MNGIQAIILITFVTIIGCGKERYEPTLPVQEPVENHLDISWQIQYSGNLETSLDVERYHIDLFDNSKEVVSLLHSKGIKVYCYINVGAWENWRPDKNKFPQHIIGLPYEGWSGEWWLDIRQVDELAPIMRARFDQCRDKGFDGMEPDNIDGYDNDTGFNITYSDQIRYNTWIAEEAHKRGLTIGLKNDAGQVIDLLPYFDWAIIEDCFVYGGCDKFTPFIINNKPVFAIEYTDTGIKPEQFCPQANSMNFNAILKNRNLDAYRLPCR